MDNPKIGTIDDAGNPQFPSQSLSGQALDMDDRTTLTGHIHMLTSTTFCIGDVFPVKGFDVQAAIDALKAEVAPQAAPVADAQSFAADTGKGAKKPTPQNPPMSDPAQG